MIYTIITLSFFAIAAWIIWKINKRQREMYPPHLYPDHYQERFSACSFDNDNDGPYICPGNTAVGGFRDHK